MFHSGFPILSTPDLERLLGFYRELMDGEVYFRYPDEGPLGYVGITVGTMNLGIGLATDSVEGAGGQRISLWIYATDCDEAVERLRSGGVTVTEEPHDQPWGERMARVLDPDGNELIVAATAE